MKSVGIRYILSVLLSITCAYLSLKNQIIDVFVMSLCMFLILHNILNSVSISADIKILYASIGEFITAMKERCTGTDENIRMLDRNIKTIVKEVEKINKTIQNLEQDAKKKDRETRKNQRIVRPRESNSQDEKSEISRYTDKPRT